VTALALALIWLRPALAGAARSVDVAGVSGLWLVWSRWLGRGLLTLALVAASVGVLERLASARRLWQGSIEAALRRQDYPRLRIGVGPKPPEYDDLADFVLGRFQQDERRQLDEMLETMAEAVECWLAEGIEMAMTRFNRT
jgi:hypothetical protein